MTNLLDTNVLLRFLVGDDKVQQQKAVFWFKQAEKGQRKIVISPIIVAEASFVLESFYHKNRLEIADSLEVFLSQRWLQVDDRDTVLSLWYWYKKGLHFVDSFLIAKAKINHSPILSFDKKLAKFS